MDLNFGLQQNEEERLDKLFRKELKKKNRRHIVSEMMEVKAAEREAAASKRDYYKYKDGKTVKKTKKTRKGKKDKESIFLSLRKAVRKKMYSLQSIYLYCLYTIMDGWDHILVKKDFYRKLASLVLVLFVVGFAVDYATGYEVTLNGYYLGKVKDIQTMQTALSNVDAKMSQWYENENMYYEKTLTSKRTFVLDRDSLMDEKECEEAVYRCDLALFVSGGVIMVDGVETARLASTEEAQDAIDSFLGTFAREGEDEVFKDMEVFQDITVREMIVDIDSVYTVNEAVSYMQYLSGGDEPDPDLLRLQASTESLASTKGALSALTFRKDDFSVGETSKPVLTIRTVKEVRYDEEIPYATKTVNDPDIYRGVTKVKSEGVNGLKSVTALITYVNGEEMERKVLSEEVIEYPKDEIIANGTKALPPAVSTGTFLIPATGRVTTLYGTSSHTNGCAIDIANSTGTPIYASDAGTVIKVGNYGTYGNRIVIKHANGYSTLYAHLSEFNCEVGDEVRQQQIIGYMGSTGYSTGPHLHFEIRYNDVRQQIERYFQYVALGQYVRANN